MNEARTNRVQELSHAAWNGSWYLSLFIMLFVACGQGRAQTLYGTITGNVTDSAGAAIRGASVIATQTETNEIRKTVSNGEGIYTLPNLPSGSYHVIVDSSGFNAFDTQGVIVQFNAVTRVDAHLAVGATTQNVTVSADSAQLQTDRSDVNAEITGRDFRDLPQPTRTYQGLLGTIAGVAPPSYSGLGTNNTDRSMAVEANGTSTSSTDVRIEGVSALQPWVPFFSSLTPSIEAIDTVSMVTASAGADQTLASGATINVQLKSGTNSFHGELYEYHTDNLLKAKPYFLSPGTGLPKNVSNFLGGTLGGPILRNRLFFFGSYEGNFNSQSSSQVLTVPTAAILAGDFTATNTVIYDPASGNADGTGKMSFLQETGRNAIPVGRVSQNLGPLLKLLAAYGPTTSGLTNNFYTTLETPERLHKIDTKVDWIASQKLRVSGRLNLHPYNIYLPENSFANLFDITPASQHGITRAFTIAPTYVVSQRLVIDGSFGFTASDEYLVPPYENVKYGADTLGIKGINLGDLPYAGGIPQFNISGYSNLGYQNAFINYKDPVYGYAANVTRSLGQHTLRFGTNIYKADMNHVERISEGFSFNGNASTLNGGPLRNQFNSFADFLLGAPSSWVNSYQPFGTSRMRSWQMSLYATDTQQATKDLTLNYGTSWAYFPVPTHGSYGLENYNLSTNVYEVCGFGNVPKDCGISVQKLLFSPHAGFAYRPQPGFVVRGGFSIDTEQFNIARDLIYNYPENIGYSATALNPYVAVGSLSAGVPTLTTPDYKQGVLPLPAGASFYALPQHITRGYVESYNLTTEKQLGSWLVQVGYVGNQSIHQHMRYNINYGQVGGGVASQQYYQRLGTSSQLYALLPVGHTNYNSLQATVSRRFSRGFQLRSTYTLSKWLGLCCDTNGFGSLLTPIPQFQSLNYTAMPGDARHVFNFTGIVESPFGRGGPLYRNRFTEHTLGGWQLNAVLQMFTGNPFTVTADGSSLNAPGSTQRADQVKPHVSTYGGKNEFFDVTAFASVTQARFGTAGYNSLYGPGGRILDGSIFRNFELPEKIRLELRMEAFNVLNTPHFGSPNSDVSSVQRDATGAITNLNGFGQITYTSPVSRPTDERNVRFGAKLVF